MTAMRLATMITTTTASPRNPASLTDFAQALSRRLACR